MAMRFEDLEVWQRSSRLSANIYKALRDLSDYGFKDQITRCSLSIPSNVAEGFERLSQKECLTFLSYAKGSCAELRTQILIGIEIGYIRPDIGKIWVKETREISSMLAGSVTQTGLTHQQPVDPLPSPFIYEYVSITPGSRERFAVPSTLSSSL